MAEERPNPYDSGIGRAIQMAGGATPLSKKLGVSRAIIYIWLSAGKVPISRAIQIETLFNIPRKDLMDPRVYTLIHGSAVENLDSGAIHYQPKLSKLGTE